MPPSSKGWDWVGDAFGKGVTWLKNFGESTPIISNLGETEETTEGKPGAKTPQSLGPVGRGKHQTRPGKALRPSRSKMLKTGAYGGFD